MHTLLRTVEHRHSDGSESVLTVSHVQFEDGSSALALNTEERDQRSLIVVSRDQCLRLANALRAAADKAWPE